MKKVFDFWGINAVEFTECTAVNKITGIRENALFVHYKNPMCANWDGVVFGKDMPESEEDARSILCDYEEDDEVIATILF